MTAPPQLSDIDRAALAWFVANRDADADAASFASWQTADARHAAAYARVERLWGSAAFAGAAKRARPRGGTQAAKRVVTTAVLAICVAGMTGVALRLSGTPMAWPADHATAVGQIAATTLDDGSRVLLDSGSAIDVAMTGHQREITLLRGRAFITVAADNRPLRVVSGDAVIRDIGTRFAVARAPDGEQVAVAEGIVDLRASAAAPATAVRLHAGQGAALVDGEVSAVRPINRFETFGWTVQRLYFANRPVAEVAQELQRYHRGWIVIANDQAARLPISGGLSLTDPVAAMEELARLSGTRLTRVTDRVLILR